MGMTLREIQTITDNFSSLGHEAWVLADLWGTSEVETTQAMTQVIYRLRALELSKVVEVAFNAAQAELERLAEAREQARAKVRATETDLNAAQAALEKVGLGKPGPLAERERALSPEQGAVSKLNKDFREAGKAAQDVGREYRTAEKKVDVMGKLLTALRSVQRADREIMRALAEALADAG